MSRELKFRSWVNDHWVDWIPTCKTLGAYNASVIDTDGYTFEEDNPFIVEQYTGLKDKNGKEIYEGDIVKCWDEDCGEVYFDTISLQYRVKFSDGDDEDLASSEPEIIGNVHENKELLDGSN